MPQRPKLTFLGRQLYRESYLFDVTEAPVTKVKVFISVNGKNQLEFTPVFGH
jgi:hypothetical protein